MVLAASSRSPYFTLSVCYQVEIANERNVNFFLFKIIQAKEYFFSVFSLYKKASFLEKIK